MFHHAITWGVAKLQKAQLLRCRCSSARFKRLRRQHLEVIVRIQCQALYHSGNIVRPLLAVSYRRQAKRRPSGFYQTKDNPLFFLTKKQVRGSMAAKYSLFYTWSQQAVPTGTTRRCHLGHSLIREQTAHQCWLRPLSRALGNIAKHSATDLPGSVAECFSKSRCQYRSKVIRILFAARQRGAEATGGLS